MRKTRTILGGLIAATVLTMMGCADNSSTGNTPPTSQEQTVKAANSAPPEVKAQVDRGVAQGQADGKAYAEKMKSPSESAAPR